jgi:hypothetical protein
MAITSKPYRVSSRHHSNNDPTTDLDPKSLLISDPPIRTYTLRDLLNVCGEGFAVFLAILSPDQRNARVSLIEDNVQSITVIRFTHGITMSDRLESGKTMIRANWRTNPDY